MCHAMMASTQRDSVGEGIKATFSQGVLHVDGKRAQQV